MKKLIKLIALFLLLSAPSWAQQTVQLCQNVTTGGYTTCQAVSASNPLYIGGTISSGVVLGTSVTVPNPYASATDTQTGLYTAGAGKIDFSSAGTQTLEIGTAGINIIGTYPAIQFNGVNQNLFNPGPPPCNLLSAGCASAYSIVERMAQTYTGNLFILQRASDSTQTAITTLPGSNFVNTNAIHSFCDGTNCFFYEIYDQAGPNNMIYGLGNATGGNPGTTQNLPLLYWGSNGLPVVLEYASPTVYGSVTDRIGGWIASAATSNLPTTGSRTLYMAADNFEWSECCDNFGYSDGPNGFTFFTSQTSPNLPNSAIFGINGEGYFYNYGAYPPGYAQIVGEIKYNQATNEALTKVLPSTCIPNDTTVCSAITTSNGAPNFPTDVSTGGNPIYVRLGKGTDGTTEQGHFQSGMIAAYATTPPEDAAVFQSLAQTHFPVKPNSCMTSLASLSAARPNTNVETGVPKTYYGTSTPNLANLVALWGTAVLNPYYNGPLFRVQRVDTGVGYDIYANGCDADQGQITADCAGTTCTVSDLFDQSGHGWKASQPQIYANMQPALSATGMNGKACVQFTPVTNITFTGSFSSSTPGIMTVSSNPTGALVPGQVVTAAGIPYRAVIINQLTGSAGGQGTYTVSSVTSTIGSETITAGSNPYLMTDLSLWPNISGQANNSGLTGLVNNMTIEAVWQTTSSVQTYGNMLTLAPNGWWFGNYSNTLTLNYTRNGVASYIKNGSTWSANQAHFGYLTADGSATQNLAMAMDNGTIATATETSQTNLAAGSYYMIGTNDTNGNSSRGCIAMLAVYNDVESPANLLAAYQSAHNEWATP